MPAIEAVFENGVFRPLAPVQMAEGARVLVEPATTATGGEEPSPTVWDILSRRYRSGQTDTAARIDEHQP